MREAERRIEELRDRHHTAGDAVHAAHSSLYETNAEFSRVQQQLQHVRENRQRISNQLAALQNQLEQGEAQLQAQRASQDEWRQEEARAREQADVCQAATSAAAAQLPIAEQEFRASQVERDRLQLEATENVQALQLAQASGEHALKILAQLAQRLNLDRQRVGHRLLAQLLPARVNLRGVRHVHHLLRLADCLGFCQRGARPVQLHHHQIRLHCFVVHVGLLYACIIAYSST